MARHKQEMIMSNERQPAERNEDRDSRHPQRDDGHPEPHPNDDITPPDPQRLPPRQPGVDPVRLPDGNANDPLQAPRRGDTPTDPRV